MGKFPEPNLIEKARRTSCRQTETSGVLDPFGRVGPSLEALRLGCETYSNDLNPVAVLIQKCTLEYPQKYGKPERLKRVVEFGKKVSGKEKVKNVLLEDVKRWGDWVLQEAKGDREVLSQDPDGSIPVGYIWARTILPESNLRSSTPSCANSWLAKKDRRRLPYILM